MGYIHVRLASPPEHDLDPEQERMRRRLDELERQGTLSRVLPRPSQPMDMAAWQAEVRRRLLREPPWTGGGRKAGPPFLDRADCLAWLRNKAAGLHEDDQPISLIRVARYAIGDARFRTDNAKSAAESVRRWCRHFEIHFGRDVKNFFQS
jgi:hypothetical protein